MDVFSHDLLIFPINHNNLHWCLASADLRNSTICYYDSMLGSGLSGATPHMLLAACLPYTLLAQCTYRFLPVVCVVCLPYTLLALYIQECMLVYLHRMSFCSTCMFHCFAHEASRHHNRQARHSVQVRCAAWQVMLKVWCCLHLKDGCKRRHNTRVSRYR